MLSNTAASVPSPRRNRGSAPGSENMDENEARAAVLTWCREVMGRAMRGGVQGQPPCRVVDVARSEPDPDRPYQRRDIVYAEGETWRECAGKLGL